MTPRGRASCALNLGTSASVEIRKNVTTTETRTPTVLLAQMIAVEREAKGRKTGAVTKMFRELSRPEPLAGLTRTYRPRDAEDQDLLPPEIKNVQVKAEDILTQISGELTDLFDIVATRETGNAEARADVVIGETTILRDVPVTYLLFLEHQLKDLGTIMAKLPVLDPSKEWVYAPATSVYRTGVETTIRTKKVPKAFTRHPGTEKHAPQVDLLQEDVLVGYWDRTLFSGALPSDRVLLLQRRVAALARAVKVAREQANSTRVKQVKVGAAIFDYILAP